MARKTRGYVFYEKPDLMLAEPAPLPENREGVLNSIKERLKKGSFRQDYGNGEFICSSLCIAKTLEELKRVETLEGESFVAHYDEKLEVYWRQGGCFD